MNAQNIRSLINKLIYIIYKIMLMSNELNIYIYIYTSIKKDHVYLVHV